MNKAKTLAWIAGLALLTSGASAQGIGIWAGKDGVEPIAHAPVLIFERVDLPAWAQAATFRADRLQINAVAGYNASAGNATLGWSLTAHWGIVFTGAGFAGNAEKLRWRDLYEGLRFTVGVQF
jgi:hypothetical protein